MEFQIGSRQGRGKEKIVQPLPKKRKRPVVGLTFLQETLDEVDSWAKRRGLSRSGLINALVTEGLERWREQDGKQEGR